ncbi:MAG: aldo/keto reductase [Bacteroidota bacterium]
MTSIPSFPLNHGSAIPALGLGVYQAREGPEVESAVRTALDCGYRLVDTAAFYGNERGVGRAIRQSGLDRAEVFVTSKVWNRDQGYASTLRAFSDSLARLDLGYLDLYLVHWPVKGKFRATWRALEEIYRSGRARAIGVSNFKEHHLNDLLAEATVTPALNQVELHPRLQQFALREFCTARGIVVQAWRPILQGQVNGIPELQAIGERYGKSGVQVTLRWMLQSGISTIPKSTNPARIAHNADVLDFALSEAELRAIAALDKGRRVGPDPDFIDF